MKPVPPKWYNDRFSHMVILIVWMVSLATASMAMVVSVVNNDNLTQLQDRKINRSDSIEQGIQFRNIHVASSDNLIVIASIPARLPVVNNLE